MEEWEEELKSLLMRVKEESEKAGLKLNTQKTKIMASGPITSWQIDGETRETVTEFIFLGSKITTDGDYSHEIKRLVSWKDSYYKPRLYVISRDITLLTNIPIVKAMFFFSSHVWMWELDYKERWRKNWCFWTMVLEKTLESPLDCKEMTVLNIHRKDWCWNWNSNILATLSEKLTHWKRPWCWERLKAGGKEDDRGWDGWMASLTRWTWVWAHSRW